MLTVAKITRSSASGYAEYLEGKARPPALGDYYLTEGERTEAPGRWAAGAQTFGLDPERPVTGEQLRTLMDVRRPDTGQELRRAGGSGEAVAAIDATFSAPKSVSAVWALADPALRAELERAHETAIDRALGYATRQVKMTRRRLDEETVIHEKATGLVATSWRHTTARAVDQQIPDPQLHSHVLLHAAVRRDGQVVAIDSRSWLVHRREVGAAYRTELAHELHHLGFAIQRGTGRGGRYFEIDGVPQKLLDRWSSRHHQVQAAITDRLREHEHALLATATGAGADAAGAQAELALLRRTGLLSPKQERLMVTATRSPKGPVTAADLDAEWRRHAAAHDVPGEAIHRLRSDHQALLLTPAAPEAILAALTEFDATFPARDARAVALEQSAGSPIQAALEQLRELRAADEILVLADRTGTTRSHRARERTVVAITERLVGEQVAPIPTATTQRETQRLDRQLAAGGGRLAEEQRTAIELACGDRRLVVIEGQAGTGKSTTLTGIARAHRTCGQQIIVTSTAALAAQRLAADLEQHGVRCEAHSTAALHAAITRGHVTLGPETTIIHDEAALASTREQLHLLDAVQTSGARLIAVGDPQQNPPVGAGGLWEHIQTATQHADAHVQLTRNQRAQHAEDRRDQALFRTGNVEQAIRGYHARDRVHLHHDPRRAEDQALDAAHLDRTSGKRTIVIAQTSNDHLDSLNARAQAIRHQTGQLGQDALPLPGRPYQLHAGDHIQIRHTIHHPDLGLLRNGTPAQITSVEPDDRQLTLQLLDGTTLQLDQQQAADADLRLAYVQHPFPAQGHTTDTTHLIISDRTTHQGNYVALTRARDTTHIYAPTPEPVPDREPLDTLAQQMSRTEPEMPSIDTPLAHETTIATALQDSASNSPSRAIAPELSANDPLRVKSDLATTHDPQTVLNQADEAAPTDPAPNPPEPAPLRDGHNPPRRTWPVTPGADHPTQTQPIERDNIHGWET